MRARNQLGQETRLEVKLDGETHLRFRISNLDVIGYSEPDGCGMGGDLVSQHEERVLQW